MGVLIAIAVTLGACYSPDIRDCVLACAADTDCVNDQVCNADHLCAAPATGCGAPMPDGAIVDARPDAPPDAPPDAAIPMVDLHIHIDGSGMVEVTGGSTCNAVDCTFQIPKNVPAILTAVPKGNHPFDHWTSMICMNQPAVCAFTPIAASLVAAKFH